VPVYRTDSAQLAPLPKSSAGYLRVPPSRLTRVGVFAYTQPDGTVRRELRHPDHVFAPESLDTLRFAPVTHKHPGDLDATKAREHARGTVGDSVTHDDEAVLAPVGIFDAELIEAIEAGESELSCGYHCEFDATPGVWNGQEYDGMQTNIRYNHWAVVPRGRAGRDVALKLDAAQEVKMASIKIGEKDVEVAAEVAEAFASLQKEVAGLTGERDAQKARADAAEVAKAPEVDVRALVKARVALETEAARHIPKDRFDSMDDLQLQLEVVKTLLPALVVEDKSAEYITAAYEAAIASRPSKSVAPLAAVKSVTAPRADSESPREAMIKRQANAWKGKK
jgi:hypothetical protein